MGTCASNQIHSEPISGVNNNKSSDGTHIEDPKSKVIKFFIIKLFICMIGKLKAFSSSF